MTAYAPGLQSRVLVAAAACLAAVTVCVAAPAPGRGADGLGHPVCTHYRRAAVARQRRRAAALVPGVLEGTARLRAAVPGHGVRRPGLADRGDWRLGGGVEAGGQAVVMVDPQQAAQRVFIGHAVQTDHPRLAVSIVQTGDQHWSVEVHNPTLERVESHCRSADGWEPFALSEAVTLAPGTAKRFELDGT